MDREILREQWLKSDIPIVCLMADGALALLIHGPRDVDIAEGRWVFGFQVPGEENIRKLQPEQIERSGTGLIETPDEAS